jgi:hypothetical protein
VGAPGASEIPCMMRRSRHPSGCSVSTLEFVVCMMKEKDEKVNLKSRRRGPI